MNVRVHVRMCSTYLGLEVVPISIVYHRGTWTHWVQCGCWVDVTQRVLLDCQYGIWSREPYMVWRLGVNSRLAIQMYPLGKVPCGLFCCVVGVFVIRAELLGVYKWGVSKGGGTGEP